MRSGQIIVCGNLKKKKKKNVNILTCPDIWKSVFPDMQRLQSHFFLREYTRSFPLFFSSFLSMR